MRRSGTEEWWRSTAAASLSECFGVQTNVGVAERSSVCCLDDGGGDHIK